MLPPFLSETRHKDAVRTLSGPYNGTVLSLGLDNCLLICDTAFRVKGSFQIPSQEEGQYFWSLGCLLDCETLHVAIGMLDGTVLTGHIDTRPSSRHLEGVYSHQVQGVVHALCFRSRCSLVVCADETVLLTRNAESEPFAIQAKYSTKGKATAAYIDGTGDVFLGTREGDILRLDEEGPQMFLSAGCPLCLARDTKQQLTLDMPLQIQSITVINDGLFGTASGALGDLDGNWRLKGRGRVVDAQINAMQDTALVEEASGAIYMVDPTTMTLTSSLQGSSFSDVFNSLQRCDWDLSWCKLYDTNGMMRVDVVFAKPLVIAPDSEFAEYRKLESSSCLQATRSGNVPGFSFLQTLFLSNDGMPDALIIYLSEKGCTALTLAQVRRTYRLLLPQELLACLASPPPARQEFKTRVVVGPTGVPLSQLPVQHVAVSTPVKKLVEEHIRSGSTVTAGGRPVSVDATVGFVLATGRASSQKALIFRVS